jgi:N utilization substance protein B
LYAHYSTGQPVDEVFKGQAARMSCDQGTQGYARRVLQAAVDHGEEIDREISSGAANWDFGRIGQMEKNILRLAIAELRYLPETPAKVIINEALELTREFSGEESRAFVNAILDRVYKRDMEAGSTDDDASAADPKQPTAPPPHASDGGNS